MKPGKTFNLSKQTKRFMATFVDPVARNHYKNMMIQAQLCSEIVIKAPTRDKNAPRGTANYQTNDTGTASTSAE
jgi:hypothetical protein